MKYALDTNIITYYLKGNKQIIDKVDREAENDNIIIPPFVYFEIKKWLVATHSKTKLHAFETLFETYGIDLMNKETLDMALSIYGNLRRSGVTIDDGDLLIAAYCILNNLVLVSNNLKHYECISALQVVNWTT
jgi:predicted nucleic acid-binding protein